MIEKQYPVTLDLVKKLQTERIEFVRGDMKTCILLITLKNDDAIANLTELNVQFFFKKSDTTKVMYDSRYDTTIITITDASNGIIKVILPLQAITSIGFGIGQISIIDGNTAKATSQEFNIYVRDGWDSALASVSEVPVLQKLISDVNTLQEQIDDAEVFRSNEQSNWRVNENTRNDSENTRQIKENSRIIAEGNRISAEAIRIVNNATAVTAEAGRVAAEIIRVANNIAAVTAEADRQHRFNLLTTSQQQASEVIDSRTSTIKNKTFGSLDLRLESIESDTPKITDTTTSKKYTFAMQINNGKPQLIYTEVL